jgi:hypothetical protein
LKVRFVTSSISDDPSWKEGMDTGSTTIFSRGETAVAGILVLSSQMWKGVDSRSSRGDEGGCDSERIFFIGLFFAGLARTAGVMPAFVSLVSSEVKGELDSSFQLVSSSQAILAWASLFDVIGVEKKAGDIGEAGCFLELMVEGVRGLRVMVLRLLLLAQWLR